MIFFNFNFFHSPQPATKLDAQLSQLRKDMQHLRQQDMQLLGHLLQINQVRFFFPIFKHWT